MEDMQKSYWMDNVIIFGILQIIPLFQKYG